MVLVQRLVQYLVGLCPFVQFLVWIQAPTLDGLLTSENTEMLAVRDEMLAYF